MWNITQSYGCTPSEAWRQLGRVDLTPRQLRRMTLAALDLAALDRAWDDMTRTHGKGSSPQPENMLRVNAARLIYEEREQPEWDAIANELTKAEAAAGTLPEGQRVAPFVLGDLMGGSEEADLG